MEKKFPKQKFKKENLFKKFKITIKIIKNKSLFKNLKIINKTLKPKIYIYNNNKLKTINLISNINNK